MLILLLLRVGKVVWVVGLIVGGLRAMVIVTMIVAIAIVRSSGFAGRHCENMCSGGDYSYTCPLLTRLL